MATIDVRGKGGLFRSSPTTTVTATPDVAAEAGDLILWAVDQNPNSSGAYRTITPPSGFTLLTTIEADEWSKLHVYYKIAGAGEPSSYSGTWSGSLDSDASGVLILSADGALSVGTPVTLEDTTDNSTFDIPALTTTQDNSWVVAFLARGGDTNTFPGLTFNGGYTEQVDVGGDWASIGIGAQLKVTAGTVAATNATVGSAETDTSIAIVVEVIETAGGGAQEGDITEGGEFGASFAAAVNARASLLAGVGAGHSLVGSAAAMADFSAGIDADETMSGVMGAQRIFTAGIGAGESFGGQAAAQAQLTARINAGATISARAAAVALFEAGLSADDSQERARATFGSISESVTADAALSALSDAMAALIAGAELGEEWAVHAQAAAQLAAAGEFGAEFVGEIGGARSGAITAGTEAAAVFSAVAQTLATLTATASLGEAIAAIAATSGQLSAGVELGATFAYLSGNTALMQAGVNAQDTFAITAAALGSLIATVGAEAVFSAVSTTRAAFTAGASFGDSWHAVGGVSDVLPPPQRTFEVQPRRRLFVVAPSNRSFRVN